MKWNLIKGNLKQLVANYINPPDNFPVDQLDLIADKRKYLTGNIQETYGVAKEEADKHLIDWQKQ